MIIAAGRKGCQTARMKARSRWKTNTPVLLAVFLTAAVVSCAGDDLGPGGDAEGYTVWIAQSVTGTVRHALTSDPIPGATVTLQAGFDEASLFALSSTKTNSQGAFSFVRGEETGVAGDFWWFLVPNTDPRSVFVRVQVNRAGFLPQHPQQKLSRTPSREPPTRNLGLYQLTFQVPMNPAPDP